MTEPTARSELPAVIDGLDCGVIVLDRSQRIVVWNAWLAVASGIRSEQVLGRPVQDVLPHLAGGRFGAAIDGALTAGASSLLSHSLHATLLPLRTRSGSTLVHNIAIRPIGERPPFEQVLIQITDITASVQRDRFLRARHDARYSAVVDHAPDAVLTLDAEGIVQLANPAAGRMFGYTSGELVGAAMSSIFYDLQGWTEVWKRKGEGADPGRPVELRGRRKDASTIYVEVSAARWTNDARGLVTAILRDVSERRAIDETLRRLNQTLEQRVAERTAERNRMWRLSTDIMLVARMDGIVAAVNPAWTTMLGWDGEELIGASFMELVHTDDAPPTASVVQRMFDDATTARFETRVRQKHGGYRSIAWTAVPDQGHLHAVGRDVTDEREHAAALARAEDQLRQSQKMEAVGHLTGGVAHDFNNLLQVVLGNLEILKRHLPSDALRLRRATENAMTGANRAAVLTQRLLAFSRRQPLAPQALDLNRLLSGMSDLLSRTLGETIQIETVLAGGLWRVEVDPNQLENAILNLAVNARDAMPNGGKLTIETANSHLDGAYIAANSDAIAGQYVVICVTDTGSGMAPETLERVFEPFFTTKEVGKGTGLGLSMVYGFVKQSGGYVKLYSETNEGTTVKIYLPRLLGDVAPEPTSSIEDITGEASGSETILVVEDNDDVRMYSVDILRELGYRVLEAHDALSALRLLDRPESAVDLLFTDVVLPGGTNGQELARDACAIRPDLKVLFTTGYARNAIVHQGRLNAGVELITKPFTFAELSFRVRAILDR